MKVQLTYFKDTGRYHCDGEYETEEDSLVEIWHEVRGMLKQEKRPGLVDGHNGYHVLVNVAGHRNEYPRLMLNAA